MKVLLSAFSCAPGRGSEPGIGWNWLQQARREHEVWLLTSEMNRQKIEREITPDVHVVYVPVSPIYLWLERMACGFNWPLYYWWQWRAFRIARKLQAKIGFDLVHHATFASWRAPSFLCLLPIPLVWGPVGGGEAVPAKLRSELSPKGRLVEGLRSICQRVSYWDPFVRLTMKRAAVILVSNRDTLGIIPERYRSKIRAITSSNGISARELAQATLPSQRPQGLVVLFVAMLEPRKAGALAIKAFERFSRARKDATLVVIGSGPEQSRLEALAERLGTARRIRFLGALPRAEVLGWMQTADVFLFPSLRDSGGFVLLEAMITGKPIVCLDSGGPGYFVTHECGHKVQPGEPEQVVADLALGLERLADNPELRNRMGEAGRRRSGEVFDWDSKGADMRAIYRFVVERPLSETGAHARTAIASR